MIPRSAVRYRRARLLVCGTGLALLGSSLVPMVAGADPVGDKQAQARALAAQIDGLGRRNAALSEQYDKSALEVGAAQANMARSVARAAQADADATRARAVLTVDAVEAYVHGGGATSRAGGAVDAQATILRAEYVQTLASTQNDHLDQYRTTAAQARTAAANLDAARQQAAAKASQLDSARSATVASEHQLQGTLAQVKGDIAIQVAQIDATRQADQARQAQQLLAQRLVARQQQVGAPAAPFAPPAPSPARTPTAVPLVAATTAPASTVGGPVSAGNVGPAAPTGTGGAAAVAAAMTRLGLPYVWAASGPDSFDCSGLTMWAWAHAGVSLPHFSGAQYASTSHIAMSDLQPGDLVFESDPGAHVAMYIGGGRIIAAPHSGTVVQLQPLSGGYVLASRP